MIITLLTAIAVILLAITITLWGIRDELRLIGKTVHVMLCSPRMAHRDVEPSNESFTVDKAFTDDEADSVNKACAEPAAVEVFIKQTSPIAKSEKPKINLNPEEAVIWREKFAMLLQDKRERMNDTKALFKKYRTTKQTWDKWASDDQKAELITLQNECRRRAGERVFSRGYYPKKGK